MSYDVSIGDFSVNMTSNVGAMFHEHIQVDFKTGLQALDGLKGTACVKHLEKAFQSISSERRKLSKDGTVGEPEFCAKYDAPNGWGSAVGGLLFLANILAACAVNRKETIMVSC